jgi:hypothetical protein
MHCEIVKYTDDGEARYVLELRNEHEIFHFPPVETREEAEDIKDTIESIHICE